MPNYSLTEISAFAGRRQKRRYALVPLAGQPEENVSVMTARAQVSTNDVACSIQMSKKPN